MQTNKRCYRCGDSTQDYPVFRLVTRMLDQQRILVCEPCAEILDRKDELKRKLEAQRTA